MTDAKGGLVYLGGSIHALSQHDYPLPPAYNTAFNASKRLVFEVDHKALIDASNALDKAGEYPGGDSLKNHVDPRTYAYLKRFFDLLNVPEQKVARYKPWYISLMLTAPSLHGLSSELGVEEFLMAKAQRAHKPVSGLESMREHMEVYTRLTDKQSEAMLLLLFIPSEKGETHDEMMRSWRRGDAEAETRTFTNAFRDYPSLASRILFARNRNWIPKIESYMHSGETYFVVAGSAHFGSSEGVLALLRQRGCKIEQM